jgi:hypothetical protein
VVIEGYRRTVINKWPVEFVTVPSRQRRPCVAATFDGVEEIAGLVVPLLEISTCATQFSLRLPCVVLPISY